MKILVISDSHGNIANLKHVMGFAKKIKVKAVIHCGDWDNKEAVETVVSYGIPLYAVLGNADVDSDIEDVLKFQAKKFDPNLLKITIDGQKIRIVHQISQRLISNIESLNIVFSGHYHFKEEKMVNFTKFVSPGAIINGINFAIFETTSGTIEFINEA